MIDVPAYASKSTSGALRRSERLSDIIKSMSQQSPAVYNTAAGTNMNVLANAIAGFAQHRAEEKGEEGLKADRTRLSDMILKDYPTDMRGAVNNELNSDQAFDLTPKGVDARGERVALSDAVRGIAEFTGNPLAARQYGDMQTMRSEQKRLAEDERNYQRGRDAVADTQWQQDFGQRGLQFDSTMGLQRDQFGEDIRQFDSTMDFNRDKLAAEAAQEAAKLKAKTEGSSAFEGAQLAAIYNKNMDALDTARGKQSALDAIETAAQQFVDKADKSGFWAQGEGWVNDLAQALSMDTTTLKSLTDRIAPLMREAGSGASSDRDIEMFKSAVVSINNTPEANKRFAAGAKAIADRNLQYTEFLNEAINPYDAQSRQKADRIWSLYKNDQRLFDDATGAVRETQPFAEWLAENMAPEASATAPPQIPAGAVAKLRADPSLAPAFDQKYGAGAARSVLGR